MKKTIMLCCLFLLLSTSAPLVASGYDTSHHWGSWIVERQPTDLNEGSEYRICDKFPDHPHREYRIIPKLDHHVFKETKVAATCTESAQTIKTCIYCSHVEIKETEPALGHDYGSWEIIKKPTTKETGVKKRVCKRCGHEETAVIPVLIAEKKNPIKLNKTDAVIAGANFSLLGLLAFLIVPDLIGLLWLNKRRKQYRKSVLERKSK